VNIFKLPDLAEGLPDAEIREWLVKVGDVVKTDQAIVVMETAKAVVEVPSPLTGKIKKLFGQTGDTIAVGDPLVEFETDEDISITNELPEDSTNRPEYFDFSARRQGESNRSVHELHDCCERRRRSGISREASLHAASRQTQGEFGGWVSAAGSGSLPTQSRKAKDEGYIEEDDGTVVGKLETSEHVLKESAAGIQVHHKTSAIKAMPAARALAKELAIDLISIKPSAANKVISVQDIVAHLKLNHPTHHAQTPRAENISKGPLTKLTQVQRALSKTMSDSHHKVMPITLMQDADIFLWKKDEDITLRLIRAIEKGVYAEPILNAYYFDTENAYQLNEKINLGLAIDTPQALYLPVIKNLSQHSDADLRKVIDAFKEKAKRQNFSPDDLKEATIILSNYGAICGTYGTPAVVPPMVAIVGVGKAYDKAVVLDGKIESHKVLPISISIDHRLITGGQVARFLNVFVNELEME